MDASDDLGRRNPEAFRFQLRRSTRTEHEALDAHPAFAALMDGTLSVGGYARLMALFLAFYRRHDPMLAQACVENDLNRFGFVYAPRGDILRDDLAALGIDEPDSARAGPASLPPIRSAGSLGGILYVLEGSMLGGSVLLRAADALVAPAGTGGDGYWRWCREAGAARWAMTCRMLEGLSDASVNRSDMIAGARLAFATFGNWLDRWTPDERSAGFVDGSLARC